MKKIDLHIHTVQSISDHPFEFSIDLLESYVTNREIDCIAITNHNLFDKEQFDSIKDKLNIVVYPGIEIDLESGHLLMIFPYERINDLVIANDKLESIIISEKDSLTLEQFKKIFPDTKDCLMIPHYKKKPILKEEIIEEFGNEITAGEVKGTRDFTMLKKDIHDKLVPVLFSDTRLDEEEFSVRQTYIDTEELELNDIKMCLKDKNKVSLNKAKNDKMFEVLPNGFMASTGLNVILGERSSGKSNTLNKIYEIHENVKYIKQFSLIEKDETKEEKNFRNNVKINQSKIGEEYLKEFRNVVDDILKVDLFDDDKNLERYLESLKGYAQAKDKLDSFSKAKLYTEEEFEMLNTESITRVINAVLTLLDNNDYKQLIEKYIDKNQLKLLLKELIIKYKKLYLKNRLREDVNSTIRTIKSLLSMKTSVPKLETCNFKELYIHKRKVDKFNELVGALKKPKKIESKELYGFTIQVSSSAMKNASEVKDMYGKKMSFVEAFKYYQCGYDYLMNLKKNQSLPNVEIYKLFIKMDYQILNQYHLNVSGGERAEFNLLNELADAQNYDILLLDEPESSFDNIFLNKSVNDMIKNISKIMPVFIVTHNSTVGESIKPDYIIYTTRVVKDSDVSFKMYGGHPTSKKLKSITGDEMDNFTILLDSLEGGEEIYEERKLNYEMLRNK